MTSKKYIYCQIVVFSVILLYDFAVVIKIITFDVHSIRV